MIVSHQSVILLSVRSEEVDGSSRKELKGDYLKFSWSKTERFLLRLIDMCNEIDKRLNTAKSIAHDAIVCGICNWEVWRELCDC